MVFPSITGIDMTGDCHDCCGVPVDCPDCATIPETWLFTIEATGDLAFLDGGTVTVYYLGQSGGYFNFLGTAVIGGCTVNVGWGLQDDTLGTSCAATFGSISVDCPACDAIQQFDGGATAGAWSFSCATPSFTCSQQQLLEFGAGTQCFTGTVGGEALEA